MFELFTAGCVKAYFITSTRLWSIASRTRGSWAEETCFEVHPICEGRLPVPFQPNFEIWRTLAYTSKWKAVRGSVEIWDLFSSQLFHHRWIVVNVRKRIHVLTSNTGLQRNFGEQYISNLGSWSQIWNLFILITSSCF